MAPEITIDGQTMHLSSGEAESVSDILFQERSRLICTILKERIPYEDAQLKIMKTKFLVSLASVFLIAAVHETQTSETEKISTG